MAEPDKKETQGLQMTSFSDKTRAVIIVIALMLLSAPTIMATETTWRHPGFEATQFDINMSRLNITNVWMLDWIFNGTVPVSAANHSRMYQGSAGKLLVSENGGAYNPFNYNGTYAAKPDSLSQLIDVSISNPTPDQIFKYNGVNWMNANLATISAGAAVGFYYNNSVSDISGYETLSRTPDTNVEQDESTVVNSNTSLFEKYISNSGLGATQIEAGEWTFVTYTYVSSISGTTELLLNVSKATADGGNITFLFNVTTGNITSTSVTLDTINTVQQAFPINSTDRLVVNVSARTSSSIDTTVHFVHSGTQHYSNIKTPLVTRHNDLAGLQGGAAGDYQHLTTTQVNSALDKNLSNYTNTPGFVTNTTVDINVSNATGTLNDARLSGNVLTGANTTIIKTNNRSIQTNITITGSAVQALPDGGLIISNTTGTGNTSQVVFFANRYNVTKARGANGTVYHNNRSQIMYVSVVSFLLSSGQTQELIVNSDMAAVPTTMIAASGITGGGSGGSPKYGTSFYVLPYNNYTVTNSILTGGGSLPADGLQPAWWEYY